MQLALVEIGHSEAGAELVVLPAKLGALAVLMIDHTHQIGPPISVEISSVAGRDVRLQQFVFTVVVFYLEDPVLGLVVPDYLSRVSRVPVRGHPFDRERRHAVNLHVLEPFVGKFFHLGPDQILVCEFAPRMRRPRYWVSVSSK